MPASQQPSATVKSFSADVSLNPGLSVGTADPESIYTARITARFLASGPGTNSECEVVLPLPPQIISLADLEVTVNAQRSESVELRGDKLVWSGVLPAGPTPVAIAYSAVGKGLYNLQIPTGGVLDTFHMELTAVGSDVRMLELSLQPTRHVRANRQTIYTWDYKNLFFGRPIALDVIALRSATIMSLRLALLGTVLPAAGILSVTLLAALNPRLQGILITAVGMTLFTVAMVLLPRLKRESALPLAPQPLPA